MNDGAAAEMGPVRVLSDDALVGRIVGGDHAAMHVLIRRYNQVLFRAARSILKNDGDAEDAVQEAWIQAWHALAGFRSEARLSTWLVRIAVNESLGRLRSENRRAEVIRLDSAFDGDASVTESSMDGNEAARPESAAERGELRRALEARIDELPDAFRTVFVLRAIQEMSVEEVAECLGVNEATVRTRHFRARAMLREALAREIDIATADAFAFAGERCERIAQRVLERIARSDPNQKE